MSGTIGLGALESLLDDIQNEEESKFNDTLENMLNSMSVEKEGQVFSALPTQSVHSLELHSAVVEHYQ